MLANRLDPRPLTGGDHGPRGSCGGKKSLDPRPLTGGDMSSCSRPTRFLCLDPRPLIGGDPPMITATARSSNLDPRPLTGGRLSRRFYINSQHFDLDPRPLTGGDNGRPYQKHNLYQFRPTPPNRGRPQYIVHLLHFLTTYCFSFL